MGILDQLLEKKDLLAYIHFRSADLKDKISKKELSKLMPKQRGVLVINTKARINELNHLRGIIMQGAPTKLKRESIMHATYTKSKARLGGDNL